MPVTQRCALHFTPQGVDFSASKQVHIRSSCGWGLWPGHSGYKLPPLENQNVGAEMSKVLKPSRWGADSGAADWGERGRLCRVDRLLLGRPWAGECAGPLAASSPPLTSVAVGGEFPSPALHLGDNCAEGVNRFWARTPATACPGPCSLASQLCGAGGAGRQWMAWGSPGRGKFWAL